MYWQICSLILWVVRLFCWWFPLLCKNFLVLCSPIYLFFYFVSLVWGNISEKNIALSDVWEENIVSTILLNIYSKYNLGTLSQMNMKVNTLVLYKISWEAYKNIFKEEINSTECEDLYSFRLFIFDGILLGMHKKETEEAFKYLRILTMHKRCIGNKILYRDFKMKVLF